MSDRPRDERSREEPASRRAGRRVWPERMRGTRRSIGIGAAVVVLLVFLGWLVAFSPVLGASHVTVHGTHTITAARVRDAAHVRQGTPLVRLDTATVAHRVETLPAVASARVSVSYPSTVVITVVERVPVGYLTAGSGATLVDRTGRQYRTVPAAPAGLPRFDVPAGTAGRATGRAVATVAAALPHSVLTALASIQATDPSNITLFLRDGRSVRWGSTDRSGEKARVLPALLARPGTFYDVTNPNLVYAR